MGYVYWVFLLFPCLEIVMRIGEIKELEHGRTRGCQLGTGAVTGLEAHPAPASNGFMPDNM
jgi:hypothetical protein